MFNMNRVNLGKSNPSLYKKVLELDNLVTQALLDAGIEEGFTHLLKLRASQINQCAFCIRMHTQDALNHGESIERVTLLNAWQETNYFSDSERASLQLVEDITRIADDQVPDSTYKKASEHLNNEQIAAIEWLAITINTWNRIGISSRYLVQP